MSVERGNLLLQTGRYDMAEREFRAALVENPGNSQAHSLLAICLLNDEKYAEATDEAQQAVALEPASDVAHATLAQIFYQRERLEEALFAVNTAIGLDPFDPGHRALLAFIQLRLRNWPAALEAADAGLAVDPEHRPCINARGIALVNLGRRDEAGQTLQGALSRDPHNAITHANQGWTLLHQGNYKPALEHFRESLRIDPGSDWAKAGIVESLKARNILYRILLKYFLFMSRLSRRGQWGIILGLYFGSRVLHFVADQNPALSPWIMPILVAYSIFAVMTWLAGPLFNLMLRLDRFGKYALSDNQRAASNWVGGILAGAAIMGIAAWIRSDIRLAYIAIYLATLMIPISAVFSTSDGWPRLVMAIYTANLALLGAAVVSTVFFWPVDVPGKYSNLQGNLLIVYMVGVLISLFLGNALAMARVKR